MVDLIANTTCSISYCYKTAQQLASATNPVILNSVTNYGYDTLARQTAMELTQDGTAHTTAIYGYDSLSWINQLGNGVPSQAAISAALEKLTALDWTEEELPMMPRMRTLGANVDEPGTFSTAAAPVEITAFDNPALSWTLSRQRSAVPDPLRHRRLRYAEL